MTTGIIIIIAYLIGVYLAEEFAIKKHYQKDLAFLSWVYLFYQIIDLRKWKTGIPPPDPTLGDLGWSKEVTIKLKSGEIIEYAYYRKSVNMWSCGQLLEINTNYVVG